MLQDCYRLVTFTLKNKNRGKKDVSFYLPTDLIGKSCREGLNDLMINYVRGKEILKVVPLPTSLSTLISPLCF